jgi:hypothetical protein
VPQFSTFQETVQLLIDPVNSKNITASVTLQSTNNQEIRVPSELNEKIRNSKNVLAVLITNEEQCVLGVVDESCIMINISREGIEGGIFAIQDTAREVGDSLIEEINEVFDTDAKFHSVFIHTQDKVNIALETSGVVSGRGTVSAVYTMPKEDTFSMYEKLSTILLPSKIREGEGFFDTAKKLSHNADSTMTFSIITTKEKSLYQLKLSLDYTEISSDITNINTLEYFQTTELKRSDYFSDGFYPLNSLVQVVAISQEPMQEVIINTNQIPYSVLDGEKIPQDLTINGWIFDGDEQKLYAKYLFGDKTSATSNELELEISYEQKEFPETNEIESSTLELDESLMFIIIIIIVAGAAAAFYLKGYKK